MKLRCSKFGCKNVELKLLKVGQSLHAKSGGFLIAKVQGYYCPICVASYGRVDDIAERDWINTLQPDYKK